MADSIAYGGLGHTRQRFFLPSSPRPRAGPWAVAECFVWLDSRYDVEKQDGRVFRWLDQSLRGEPTRHVAQATVDRRPDYIATDADFNNKPVFRFYNDSGGRDSWLKGASDMSATAQPMTWYAVAAHNAGASGGGPIFSCTSYTIATDDTETYASGDDEVVGLAVSADASHVFCLVKDSANVNLYIDDMTTANATRSDSVNNGNTGAPLLIGDDGNQSTVQTQFSGRIAMVAGFEGAHTLEQRQTIADYLAAVFVPSPFALFFGEDLKHLWDSYESDTGIWTDRVGGDNGTPVSGTPTEGVTNEHQYPEMLATNALRSSDITTLDGRDTWTIFGIIKTNGDGNYGGILTKDGHFKIEGNYPGGIYVSSISPSGGDLESISSMDDDQWHRFIATNNAGTAKLYIDGALEATDASFPAFNSASTGVLQLGNNTGFSIDPYSGSILLLAIATAGVDATEASDLDALMTDWVGAGASVPVVSAITYAVGNPTGGGTRRRVITVDDSTGCTGATLGGVAMTSFAIDDATHVSGIPGAHAAGVVDVVVTNGSGPSTTGTGLYEYWDPPTETVNCGYRSPNYDGGTAVFTADVGTNLGSTGAVDPVEVAPGEPDCEWTTDFPLGNAVDANTWCGDGDVTFAAVMLLEEIHVGPVVSPNVYTSDGVIEDLGGYCGLHHQKDGSGGFNASFIRYDGTAERVASAAMPGLTGVGVGYAITMGKLDGTTMYARAVGATGNGSWTSGDTVSSTTLPAAAGNFRLAGGGAVPDGIVKAAYVFPSAFSDALASKFEKWAQAEHGP